MKTKDLIDVHSCKYDGRIQRRWGARIADRAGSLILLEGVFEEEVRHPLLGHIRAGTHSTEYFWTDRWYSVFRFRQPEGVLRNYYCNVNTPPRLDDSVLSFIDLDIDVLVAPDFSHQILDEDEFETHAALFNYPPEFRRRAHEALDEILRLVRERGSPFGEGDG
jgi:protein associated with RNAse G/E